MSIPPLVCSTPPPPDQCEDDKDPEDFDLSYNLSQEDDEYDENNAYNYGNYSTYNHFQSASDNKPLEIKEQEITKKNIDIELHKEVFLNCEKDSTQVIDDKDFRTNDINENKIKCEEDVNIEDLNLKVDDIDSIVENNNKEAEVSEASIDSVKDLDIPSNSNDTQFCDTTDVLPLDESAIDSTDVLKEINTNVETVEDEPEVISSKEPPADIEILQTDSPNELNESFNPSETLTDLEDNTQELDLAPKDIEVKLQENEIDDFGDFDDFQSVNTTSDITNIVESSDNPWENEGSHESDFGNFTANFEDKKFQTTDDFTPVESITLANNLGQFHNEVKDTGSKLDDDDDFGDFDDFKSSAIKTEPNEFAIDDSSQCHDLPVLNLQLSGNENQIMESITKVLSTVYLEEISEPESEFDGKLEALLSETWGHLMETDERQPYIVNWNNSLGQKTLLKSLCIDSRNILFGPKWSSNMPKYAANLSNAPLQPQKQPSVPSSIVTQTEIVAEKSSSKPTTWTDPFTSDGQESCNTENESATTITPGPTDLDVFEATVPTKSDKIFSNTMSVQPLRQINLPDTHIFTPTDSEIPRSKTIHYDRGPSVLLPQAAATGNKNPTDTSNIPSANTESNTDDNEYWEFQNFKGASDTSSLPGCLSNQPVTSHEINVETATTVNALPPQNIAYQTELLQPIKVEPTMPTLNWPDPGEVKAVYEDFSDFVSISSQPSEKQDTSIGQFAELRSDSNMNIANNLNPLNEKVETPADITQPVSDSFDDEFDTFQSAPPSISVNSDFQSCFGTSTPQVSSSQIPELDLGSSKFDSIKSDTISFPSMSRPSQALTQNLALTSNTTELNRNPLPPAELRPQVQSNVLQPTPASFSTLNTQSQQKSAQILEPLSLESYSQINWPSPGIDLQDLSRFNPVESVHSLKSDSSVSGLSKLASPVHAAKNATANQVPDDDVWGEFVSSKPKQQQSQPKKPSVFVDDDEWTDFISSPSVMPKNGLNTISLNVHTNSNIQKSVQNKFAKKSNQPSLDIPTLNYITPKSNPHKSYNDKHFQNL